MRERREIKTKIEKKSVSIIILGEFIHFYHRTEDYKILFEILAKYLDINECPFYYVCIHIIIIV